MRSDTSHKFFCFEMLPLLLLAACASSEYVETPYQRVRSKSEVEVAFVKEALASIQVLSIEKNREYCGFIGLNASEVYAITDPRKGRKGSCRPKEPVEDFTILASYHTHGAWSEDFDSEVPSYDDLQSDISEGTDGYVLTPGGRLWYNDAVAGVSQMECGLGCLETDPDFQVEIEFPIRDSYTLEELKTRTDSQR